MRISYFSFGTENPYQKRFYGSLADAGASLYPLTYRPIFPLSLARSFDIVHLDWLHSFYKSRSYLRSVIKKMGLRLDLKTLKRPKIIWTVHNILSHDSFLPLAFEKTCIELILRRVDAVMGFSDAVIERLCDIFPEAASIRHFVIPHGHYIDDYPPCMKQRAARKLLGIPEKGKVILFLGALRENKGIADLVEAFRAIRSEQDAQLIIAGSGETGVTNSFLDTLALEPKLLLERRFIPDHEIPVFFGACDIVALPFREILNSGSAILAVSMGKCILVPELPTITENLPIYACFTYPPGDLAALTSTLARAMEDPTLPERGKAGRQEIQATLNWTDIGKKALHMYEALFN